MATLLSTPAQKTRHYQTDQQVKYLHLEAEVDMLLQKLTTLKELSAKSSQSTNH